MRSLKIQPIPYQGSKRCIAERVMQHAPTFKGRLIEPFGGSGAITIYSAYHGIGNRFLLNDSYGPLMQLWARIINDPEGCALEYERMWTRQLDDPNGYYMETRKEFNEDHDPVKFLFLLARCVKNSVRFNSSGQFNQSADKRRLGRSPEEMRTQLISTSLLLKKRVELMSTDYETVLELATPDDLVYMDPPYQGTSTGKNPRYHQGLDLQRFTKNLQHLKDKGIPFILSFDGQLGDKKYGDPLPENLNLEHIGIHAGRSAQATLNGKTEMTVESLYISSSLIRESIIDSALVSA